MESLRTTYPEHVWKYFSAVASIPRPSKKEEKIRKYLKDLAAQKKLSYREDGVGNVAISVPATPGKESAPTVIIQGHLDMVTEKNASFSFDFDTQPIPAYVDGEWIRTRGTTLGADNGIGVAAALAVIDDQECTHGPLELLFTIDEETGLTGATNLSPTLVKGKYLLNLDSEDEGTFYIGCAGGSHALMNFSAKETKTAVPSQNEVLKLFVHGLSGGHSGLNIVENRGNAIKILARLLRVASSHSRFEISDIEGGSKHNAIPREATAVVSVDAKTKAVFVQAIETELQSIRTEFSSAEPALAAHITNEKNDSLKAFSSADSLRLVDILLALPNGVLSMSRDIPGLVETSTNLATVKKTANGIEVLSSIRSSVEQAMDGALLAIQSIVNVAEGSIDISGRYPAWRPNPHSALLAKSKDLWLETFGKAPKITAIHAGLECGVILEKYPNLDVLSFGPTITGAHSPAEALSVPSTQKFYTFLKELLLTIANER